jgi:hypothetical protein
MTGHQVESKFTPFNIPQRIAYNKLKPFEKAKVKQLREEAKKKEKSETRNVAVVTTQEVIPPKAEESAKEGTKASATSNAGNQFGRAAHDEQKKKPS